MAATIESYPDVRNRLAAEPTVFSVPARHNPRLQNLVERIHQDDELRQLWRCANLTVLNRPELGLSNWSGGRLFGRSAVLSGDSVFTIRTLAVQHERELHR